MNIIVTGYKGVPHVTEQQERFMNQAALGSGTYILNTGNKLSCTIDSATQVTLADGGLSMQGCAAMIPTGSSQSFEIEAGTSGMKRIDYIVAQYTKGTGGVESVELLVKTGTPSSGTPTPPAYATGSIENGDTLVEAPVWQVNIDGLAIASVSRVAPIVQSAAELMALCSSITSLIGNCTPYYSFASGSDLLAALGSMAIGTVFIFKGTGTFSQDVLRRPTQANAFGIIFKNSSTSCVVIAASSAMMFYATFRVDGTGTAYIPLKLDENAVIEVG